MAYLLLFGGTTIGRLELDDGEPAAGYLEPLPGYDAVREVFQLAGDMLWLGHFFRFGSPTPRVQAILDRAEQAKRQLTLATEQGAPIEVVAIDLADAKAQHEPPFVLVYFAEHPGIVGARVAPRHDRGDEGSRPAA